MLLPIVFLLILQLIPIFAIPTKQLKQSLILEKPFNSLNSECVFINNDDTLVISKEGVKKNDNDMFMAQFSKIGSFELESKQLIVARDGTLKLDTRHIHKENESNTEHDEVVQEHIFSIKNGKLSFNGFTDFRLCPLNDELFSIHLQYSESANDCESGAVDAVQFSVFNQLGIQAEDFEAPEFIYNTGKLVYF